MRAGTIRHTEVLFDAQRLGTNTAVLTCVSETDTDLLLTATLTAVVQSVNTNLHAETYKNWYDGYFRENEAGYGACRPGPPNQAMQNQNRSMRIV